MNNPEDTKKIVVALLAPSDITRDKDVFEGIIKNIQDLSHTEGCPYFFEVKTFEGVSAGADSQRAIDDFIKDANVSIAVFHNKVGTKYTTESSATVHEINNVLLRRMRKKYEKNAPRVMVYFLKPDIESYEIDFLNGLLEIQKLKTALHEEEKLYRECDNLEDVNKRIRRDLRAYSKTITGEPSDESDFFMENMISERVFAYLEMDNGYSERIFKLFDNFMYEGTPVPDRYFTNFIFDYEPLDTERLGLLHQRFKGIFASFICGKIQDFRDEKAKEAGVVTILPRIRYLNFSDYAYILYDNTYKIDKHSFESILDSSALKLAIDIAETLHSNIYSKVGVANETNFIDGARKEFLENAEALIRAKCSEGLCSNILSANNDGSKKLFVFITPMVTEPFLKNVNEVLAYLNADESDLPTIFLFAVIESPGEDELKNHLENWEMEESPNILGKLSTNGKLRFCSYVDRLKLNTKEIVEKIYYNM